jgi:hypothetical protein
VLALHLMRHPLPQSVWDHIRRGLTRFSVAQYRW